MLKGERQGDTRSQWESSCRVGVARLRDGVLAASKVALERMEASRKVFLKGRALALAQRMALYARDELHMSTLRIRVRPLAADGAIASTLYHLDEFVSLLRQAQGRVCSGHEDAAVMSYQALINSSVLRLPCDLHSCQ